MANAFKPRSWKLRADAAKHRAARDRNMADIRAVRAALIHGEPVPVDALARLNAASIAVGSVAETVSEVVEAEGAPEIVVESETPVEAPVEPEPKKPGRAARKPA